MTPQEARRFQDICDLKTDHWSGKHFWLQVDVGVVTVAEQDTGEACTGMTLIPRQTFDAMVRWYLKDQKR